MIRDRGNIKWAGMMLTEHNVELKHWLDKEYYTERPELSEWELQGIQEEIETAYKSKYQILIKTWKDGKFMTRGGAIKIFDLQSKSIVLDNPFGLERIPVAEIVSAQHCE